MGTLITFQVSFYALLVPIGLLTVLTADIAVGWVVERRDKEVYDEQFDEENMTKTVDPEMGREEDAVCAAEDISAQHEGGRGEMTSF